jgi:type IV pilus assembly protein PilW
MRKNKGLSIVELLVATAIVLIVMSMAITIYIATKEQYNNLKTKTNVEVKELTAKALIESVVKNAGFACKFGYTNQTPYIDETGDSLESYFLGSGSAVRVGPLPFDATSHLPAVLQSTSCSDCAQSGTDYILIRTEETHTKLTANNSLSISLDLDDISNLDSNDYLALCNKDHINLVKISSISSGSVTLSQSPSESVYFAGDYAGKYELQILYTKNIGEQDDDGNDIYSLYAYVKEGASQGTSYELVRGIKDLQVEYATVSGGDVTWNSITTDLELDSSYPAIKILFTVDGQSFSKIVTL